MSIRTIELQEHIGTIVTINGRLHRFRQMGGVGFLMLADGWGVAQVVVEDVELAQMLAGLAYGSVLEVCGEVVASELAQAGVEIVQPQPAHGKLQIADITPITAQPPFTMHKKTLNVALPTLLDHAVVGNRHPTRQALLRLSAGVMAGFRATLDGLNFTEIQSPKLVESATESGADVFEVGYFGKTAYLAQSPQFYKQIMVSVFDRVYEVGPVFRAEQSNTSRHLTEYVSLDVEFGYIENHFTVMEMVRTVLAGIFERLEKRHLIELATLNLSLPSVPDTIPHLHFTEAQTLLYERFSLDERGEPDLSPQSERLLGQWAQAEHSSDFLFVTGYPMVKRPFYTHADPVRPAYSNSFDLLFRGLELVTGGQRLHRHGDYLNALKKAGLPAAPFATYLEAFKHGMPPHGGFAIGLERLLMQLTGATNIRETTLFPRGTTRLSP